MPGHIETKQCDNCDLKKKEVGNLNNKLKNKDSEINTINKKFNSLEDANIKNDDEIKHLKGIVEKSEELLNDSTKKAATISHLNKDLVILKDENRVYKEAVAARDDKILKYTNYLTAAHKKIRLLKV